MKARDLTGRRFGRWSVIRYIGNDESQNRIYLCKCDCGTKQVVTGKNLTSGRSKSCGCLKKERAKDRRMKMTKPAELYLAIAYLGAYTFRVKDVREFLKNSDTKYNDYLILGAMQEMNCYKVSRYNWQYPDIPSE